MHLGHHIYLGGYLVWKYTGDKLCLLRVTGLHVCLNVLDHGASVWKPRGEFTTHIPFQIQWPRRASIIQNSSAKPQAHYPSLPPFPPPVTSFVPGLFLSDLLSLSACAPFHHIQTWWYLLSKTVYIFTFIKTPFFYFWLSACCPAVRARGLESEGNLSRAARGRGGEVL